MAGKPGNFVYFPALTGVRAIAAWMVFAHHFNPFDPQGNLWLHNLVYVMHTGVSIFFVLSGFLIWHRYHHNVEELLSWRYYFQNRFARIFPLYFVLATATFLTMTDQTDLVTTYLLNITLIKGYFHDILFSGISQGWTLTVEETFYVVAPLIFLFISPKRNILPRIAAVVGMTLVLGIVMVLLLGNVLPLGFMDSIPFMLTYSFFGRCTEFMCGVLLGVAYARYGDRLRDVTSQSWFIIVGRILFGAILIAMAFFAHTTTEVVLNNFLLPISIAMLFGYLITQRSAITDILSSKALQLLGKSSYAFYLIHVGIIQVWLSEKVSDNTIILFVIINVVAIALYYSIERPMLRVLRR
jgi:peptidoglycan/LPS O-acetylase OafA/YrhL